MNGLLDWLGVRHHRYLSLYCGFVVSAMVVLGHQMAFGWPLTALEGSSDLTILSALADKTLLTRLAASTLDYGIDWSRYLMQVRWEDVVFILGAVLLTRKTDPYPTHWILRILLSLQIVMNLGLALVFNQAFSASDVEAVLQSVRSFGWIFTLGSALMLIGVTLEGIRLCFVGYSD
jgi:hypothetical protein